MKKRKKKKSIFFSFILLFKQHKKFMHNFQLKYFIFNIYKVTMISIRSHSLKKEKKRKRKMSTDISKKIYIHS